MSEYKKEFLSEARDHLDNLNENLLILEKEPENEDIINECFRSFHTLKGNSATMGFEKFSHVAHDLEDVLGKIRDKELSVNEDVMDILFKGCDLLEEGLDLIDQDKADELDPTEVLVEVKKILKVKDEKIESVDIGETMNIDDNLKKKIEKEEKSGKKIYRIIIIFKESAKPLKGAKSLLLLRDLNSMVSIITSNPSLDDIKGNKFDLEYEMLVSSKNEKEDIIKVIDKISGIEQYEVLSLDEKFNRKKDKKASEHHNKEVAKNNVINKHKNSMAKQIQSVKVDIKRLDNLMNAVGELLINNLRLNQISQRYQDKELMQVIAGIDRITSDLQEEIMSVRMVPIGNIFNRFPRMIRDLAKKENKKINLIIEGNEIEFDRTILDEIGDPLVHLLRNSVDHGVELPDERINKGKDPVGTIKLIARREKNNAVVEISDDGAGIDAEKVKKKALEKGLITTDEAEKMSESELQRLIFKPGLSTNQVVTEVSGRGVGMDVVETKIKELGGSVSLHSEFGKGTTVLLTLPLTVAIVNCLMVEVSGRPYAIPIIAIERTVQVRREDIKTIQNQKVFILRDNDIPLLDLHKIFGFEPVEREKYEVIIIENGDEKVGLIVDKVITQQQILIKSLDKMVKGIKGIGGATILGDGSVSLIIDVGTLL